MPYYIVIRPGGPYPVGRKFVGSPDVGLKPAVWIREEPDEPEVLRPKPGQLTVIPFHIVGPYLKELTNDNTGSLRDKQH